METLTKKEEQNIGILKSQMKTLKKRKETFTLGKKH